ncbi:MAG TPA: hypothetical protein VGH32_04805 [Pirellulales bacterium]
MAKRKSAAKTSSLQWKQRPRIRLSTAGGRFVSYSAFPQPYRIDHYLTCGELPFFAVSTIHGVGTKQISRHATLAEAKIACERHLEEQL